MKKVKRRAEAKELLRSVEIQRKGRKRETSRPPPAHDQMGLQTAQDGILSRPFLSSSRRRLTLNRFDHGEIFCSSRDGMICTRLYGLKTAFFDGVRPLRVGVFPLRIGFGGALEMSGLRRRASTFGLRFDKGLLLFSCVGGEYTCTPSIEKLDAKR